MRFNPEDRLRTNFRAKEIWCPCCKQIKMDKNSAEFLDMLQELRIWYNKSMQINSCYRCEKFNKKIGGHKRSNHLNQTAADIAIPTDIQNASHERLQQWRDNMLGKWIEICRKHKKIAQNEVCLTWLHLGFVSRTLNKSESVFYAHGAVKY